MISTKLDCATYAKRLLDLLDQTAFHSDNKTIIE